MYGVQSSVHVWGNAPQARIVTKQQRCSLLYGVPTLYKSVPAGGSRALLDMGSIRHSQGYYDMTGTGLDRLHATCALHMDGTVEERPPKNLSRVKDHTLEDLTYVVLRPLRCVSKVAILAASTQ